MHPYSTIVITSQDVCYMCTTQHTCNTRAGQELQKLYKESVGIARGWARGWLPSLPDRDS